MSTERRFNFDRRASRGIKPTDVLHVLIAHPVRWAGPLVLCTIAAAAYAYLKPATWEATQALLVRDEVGGKTSRPGHFGAVEEMKTAQETVLELIKSRTVLEGALKEVCPPAGEPVPADWPSERTIESLGDAIKIVPPKGAEFGKTEVFYLKVLACNPPRAIALAKSICHQLESQFDDLRYQKYRGIIDELTRTVSLAQADLDTSTESLASVEREAGPDLAELRILNESPSNDSGLRRVAVEIETELRTYRASVASNQELLKLLQASQDDAGRLLASPGRLLDSQPALKRLKDGLVDAELRTAQLLGNMAEDHPAVVAAKASEQEVSQHLHQEISIAIKGLELDLRLANERVQRLEEQRQDVQKRLVHLATIRAQYSNLAAAVRNRGETLKTAQQELAEARASQASARTASLITLVGAPTVGSRPAGPGKTMILLAGMMGGLALGAGIVFLTIESAPPVIPAHAGFGAQNAAPQNGMIQPASPQAPPEAAPPALAPAAYCGSESAAPTQAPGRRASDAWPVEGPSRQQTANPPREKVAGPATTAPRPTPSRAPVTAGSLSLQQALGRLFPGASS